MTNKPKEQVLKLSNLTLGYKKRPILEDINLEVFAGDYIGIIGANGAGKTTLLRAILGLLSPLSGRVEVSSGINFGYVMQRQYIDTIFHFTVKEVVIMGRYGKLGPFKHPSLQDKKIVKKALATVGAAHLANEEYRRLSGGQKQRVLIARALASEADILVLDEPTNDMDIKGEQQIMELITSIRKESNVTVILVSHLLNVVLNYVDSIAFLHEKKLEYFGTHDFLQKDHLSKIFGMKVKVGHVDGKKFILT